VSGSFRRGLLALTVAGVVARLLFVVLEPHTYPVADETMWLTWGTRVLPSPDVDFSPLRLRFIFHPPLYLYFLGGVYALFGSLTAIKVVQGLLGASLAPALGLIGARALGERAGLVAAAVAALYPELVWFCAHFWVETIFTMLLWWGFERLVAADALASSRVAALAGLLFGLSVLARETALYFLPVAVIFLAWRRPTGRVRGALFLACALLVILPWTVRNWLVFHAFVPVSTAGALNLWQGNTRLSRQEVYEEYWAVHGRIEKYRHARERAIESILRRQPWWLLEKIRDEMPEYWAAHGQPIVHLERGAYGDVPRGRAFAAIAVVLAPYLLVLALFVVGVAAVPLNRATALLLSFLVFYALLHVAAHGYPRYRIPSLPVLFLLAGQGWVFLRTRPRPRLGRRRVSAAAVVGLLLALFVGPSLVRWVRDPWPPAWTHDHSVDDEGPTPGSRADDVETP
jgi:Dolichyl-phosphate-mannose-protein mannosyltransferase